MRADERSFRIALVADRYVNPPRGAAGAVDAVAAAAQAGWGVMQLPPDDYPAEVTGPLLAEVAEQVGEFSRHGYAFVLVGDCPGLTEALARVGVAVPEQIVPATSVKLLEFLYERPAPAAGWDPSQIPG
jgi:hypothetical protein